MDDNVGSSNGPHTSRLDRTLHVTIEIDKYKQGIRGKWGYRHHIVFPEILLSTARAMSKGV